MGKDWRWNASPVAGDRGYGGVNAEISREASEDYWL